MSNPKKHLSFTSLRQVFSNYLHGLEDERQISKCEHELHDVVMSAFACMYFQEPSLLAHQKRLEDKQHNNNIRTLFDVKTLPSDSQIRRIIDEISTDLFSSIFQEILGRLQRGKHLEQYQLFPGRYLCAIDGTQFFSSKEISCEHCLQRKHTKNKSEITYSHQAVQAAIVHPDCKQVLPIMPEEVRNEDGSDKQDCEVNAAKRLIKKLRGQHRQLDLIVIADSIFSKQPFIETLKQHRISYILVAKPGDHIFLMDWIDKISLKNDCYTDEKGHTHRYEWINNVSLNSRKDSLCVNYLHYYLDAPQKDGSIKTTYQCSWVTDMTIGLHNIKTLVKAGRCRWKIENECFNTLKNQGYHIEHNYGHGQKNLCFNFYLLTLLSFFFHQVLELTDKAFRDARAKLGTLRELWETLRQAIKWFIFECWEGLLHFAYNHRDYHITHQLQPP